MFEKLKERFSKAGPAPIIIGAPTAGEVVPLSEVADATFAQEILGKGAAIHPTDGKIVSPVNGTVQTIFDTGHAVSILSDDGAEILIHVGLDTVKLKGAHFVKHAENGKAVQKGDLLIECDLKAIRAEGYDIITPVIICNSDEFPSFTSMTGHTVQALDTLLELKKS